MRMPEKTAALVKARAGGRCERCGTNYAYRWSIHHRKPRGMGGTKDPSIHSVSNLVYLCGSGTEGCHGWVEANRQKAKDLGLLLYRADVSVEIPIALHYGIVLLDDEGGWQTC